MSIKRKLALLLTAALLCAVCGGLWVAAEQEHPEGTSEDRLFWVTHYNDGTVEGAGVIFTEEDTAGGWWLHVAFAPTKTAGVYEITAITNGLSDGSATAVEVPEGGFVWAANYGNDYASMEGGGINYTSETCTSAIEYAKTWSVGDRFAVHGVDFESVPTSTSELNWYDAQYVCTATIAPHQTDPVAALHAELKALVGADNENAVFAWSMEAETDEEGLATVTVTVNSLDAAIALKSVGGGVIYDHEAMTLLNDISEENELDCVTTLPGKNWENLSCPRKDDNLNNIPGELELGLVNATDNTVISTETPLILTLRFRLNEGYDLGGVYIPTESVFGGDSELNEVAGNGTYAILQRAQAPETPVESSEESSEPPQPGDGGIVWFALLGATALVGGIAAWKSRRAEA